MELEVFRGRIRDWRVRVFLRLPPTPIPILAKTIGLTRWRIVDDDDRTANQNLFLAIHEITHNLAFKKILHNKLLAIFANLPIGIPYAMVFKRYHLEHHKALGEDGIDTDLPTKLELLCLRNVLGKTFFAYAPFLPC
jgi:hypothetical protein